MTETWSKIKGEPEHFEVSTFGRMRRLAFVYNRVHNGKMIDVPVPEIELVGSRLSAKGYKRINFNNKTRQLHRVVAETFVSGQTAERNQVNHKDGNKLNNDISNLEWVSNQENRDHAVLNGLQARGAKVSLKLSDKDVEAILNDLKAGKSQYAIAEEYAVCQQTISAINTGKTWTHLLRP